MADSGLQLRCAAVLRVARRVRQVEKQRDPDTLGGWVAVWLIMIAVGVASGILGP